MPVTQSLNSKANVKKFTNQDVPFNQAQPVMSSFYAVSTAGQTVINLSFSVDQTLTDQFFLFVDGKKLRLGAANDYLFTSIGADNKSSQVTLNQALAINLNIQAYQLGLKTETEFGTDNRFNQLYAAEGSGFQAFVDQTSFIRTATTATGTPAAGTFHSTVLNRAPMVDLSQNLKPNMGIERMTTQSLTLLQNEQGPNGEQVFGTPNDIFGQIRFVGGRWSNDSAADNNGPKAQANNIGDYVEITFYGTGLNVLGFVNATTNTWQAAVDGGSPTTILSTSTGAGIITGRNYNSNAILPAATGLALGVHTVKITLTAGTFIIVQGFEILNDSGLVKVNPGIGYIQGKKYTSGSQSSFAYNSMATGTRGGRTVVYQNGDGTISTAWQAVNAAQANLTSADHTNEEIARTYNWREFGAGRTDDFSQFVGTSTLERCFTLDDGTTTLVAKNMAQATSNGLDTFYTPLTTDFFTIVFVGTGLDILVHETNTGAVDTYNVTVDGTLIGGLDTTAVTNRNAVKKVVSGLPYGTHTARFQRTAVSAGRGYSKFIVYQPKKPSIPSGAIELSDYNVMADYSGATITGATLNDNLQMPLGTLFKAPAREFIYNGANQQLFGIDSTSLPGLTSTTLNNNSQPASYTFFGTGFVLHLGGSSGGTYDFTVSIDGSLNATGVARSNASNLGGGSYRSTSSTAYFPTRVEFTGLTLGTHTVSFTRSGGAAGNFTNQGLHIITPIHSHKSNLLSDLQNTLPIGSQGISDNRKISPVKDNTPIKQTWAQATDLGSNASTTSSSLVPLTDMSLVIYAPVSGSIDIQGVVTATNSANNGMSLRAYLNGMPVGLSSFVYATAGMSSAEAVIMVNAIVPVGPGYHKIDLYYAASSGGTSTAERRTLNARFRA